MKKSLTIVSFIVVCATIGQAVSVRYFLSLEGLADPNDTDGPAVMPTNIGVDPVIDTTISGTSHRLYMWAKIGPNAADGGEDTDLKGLDLAFFTSGDIEIVGGNIWQNHFDPFVTKRWNDNGFPGAFGSSPVLPNNQFADPSSTIAVLEAGITNGPFAAFDDQWIGGSLNASVFGYLDIEGTFGEVDIIHQGTGFLQIQPNNVVRVGWHDNGFGPMVPFPMPHNSAPEALLIPEPVSLFSFAFFVSIGAIRRR